MDLVAGTLTCTDGGGSFFFDAGSGTGSNTLRLQAGNYQGALVDPYLKEGGGGAHDYLSFKLDAVAVAVPEPSSLAFMLAGRVGVGVAGRRWGRSRRPT